MKKRKKTDMPPLVPEEEEDDTQVRGGSGAKWVTLLCVILAIALIVASLPSGISAVTKVNSKVLSAVPEENTISTVLSGGGTLSPQEGTAQSLPQALELETYYVKNGQTVSEGDPIAQVDLVAVKAAISELQEVIDTLDAAIASESSKTNDSVIRSGTAGRVKKIYAQKDRAVADTADVRNRRRESMRGGPPPLRTPSTKAARCCCFPWMGSWPWIWRPGQRWGSASPLPSPTAPHWRAPWKASPMAPPP